MKNFWLPKLSILASLLATLAGCPAMSNVAGLVSKEVSKEQSKPKKTLTITDIPSEYEGNFTQVVASDSSDTSGERLCVSGGIDGRDVKNGKVKTIILEMSAKNTAVFKNLMGIAKSCDNKERIVVLSFLSVDSAEENPNIETSLNNTFIYTKGVNICEVNTEALANTKFTYSFSEMESTLKFSDFMRASDCEMLVKIVQSMLESSPSAEASQ